jgi:hypothetical protein
MNVGWFGRDLVLVYYLVGGLVCFYTKVDSCYIEGA